MATKTVTTTTTTSSQGNMGLGVVVGFILMIFLGWIPVIGALIAGFAAGGIAKGGAKRGLIAGFLSGIVGLILLTIIFTVLGGATHVPFGELLGGIIGTGVSAFLLVIDFGGIILVSIGGLMGGALIP